MSPITQKSNKTDLIELHIQRYIPAKPWRVLRMISRVKDYPKFMPNVRKVEVIEQTDHSAITRWLVEIEGLPIQWTEKDTYDLEHFTVYFKLIEGDLEQFEGQWSLQNLGEGTEVTVEAQAKLGIPILEKVVSDILQQKLTRNFEMTLDAMEDRFLTERYRKIGTTAPAKPSGFVVMGHPYNFNHLVRIFKFFKPDLKTSSKEFLSKLFELTPAYHSYDIPEYRSASGKTTHGYFIMCPIIPDMAEVSPEKVFKKVAEGCRIGERLGGGIVALGGFTSVVGERYQEKLRHLIKIPLTTGNAFTAAMALEGVRKAASLMEIDLKKAKVTIIGGTGDIGSACARVLSREVKEITLTGRNKETLKHMKGRVEKEGKAKISISTNNNDAVKKADIVIAAASTAQSVVDAVNFKPGAIVCDVGYPKNTSYLLTHRNDIFAFSGGLCELPNPFDLGFDIGLPNKKILYGCFAEAIILSLEERYENFSRGKGHISPEQIETIKAMGEKHGFKLAPFYWGERLMSEADIRSIQSHVSTR